MFGDGRTRWELQDLERGQDGNYLLLYDTPDGRREIRTRSVAMTAPAYVVADLVRYLLLRSLITNMA